MKKILTVVLCLAAGVAWSQDSNEAETDEEKVDLYISTIENINVTAEKPMTDSPADTNEDIDAILEAADKLESDEAEE